MLSHELRTKYLKFFESKGHLIHSSDSLVPDDPSLLYTSAGMVQFKPYFVGSRVPPSPRVVTSQKCMRTDDIDEVGDAFHHTFFEMLGNFSFGDYFKRDSILWAWEFLTEVLEINPDHIWTSVYLDDDEAYDIWVKEVGLAEDRIVRLGEDKNYWPADAPSKGPNGPCGPCNEIFIDMTPELGRPEDPAWSIAHDGARFLEIWNLVFQQFDRQEDGTMRPLPTKNIDTGMGFERAIKVLNRVSSDYDTDLFQPIIERIESISGASYGSSDEVNIPIRVIADHIRAAVFTIADGVMPSNVGRGHVLRRLIRRSVIKGRQIGIEQAFINSIVPVVIEIMGDVYPEIADRQPYIEKVLGSEEDKFRHTLESGLNRLEEQIYAAASSEEKILDGEIAFTLYDTYGFPLELTKEIAAENGVEVDTEGFDAAMEEQRQRARESSDFATSLFGGGGSIVLELEKTVEPTKFIGYEQTAANATVQAIVKNGEFVSSANEGDEVDLILDTTPFYAESGGQVGDTGAITADGAALEVADTVKAGHFFVHKSKVVSGTIAVGEAVKCNVDIERRKAIARNHTATHLLHAALHKVLGEHALQKGSVVEPGRLRFDFSHFQAVTPEEMRRIEDEVNAMVLSDVQANVTITNIEEARKLGATALFGDKYGDEVRVVKMGEVSIELCGGTHLQHTAQVGLFKLLSESSVGAGLRRMEGVTGAAAVEYIHDLEDQIKQTAAALGTSPSEMVAAAERAVQSLKDTQREVDKIKSKGAAEMASDLASNAVEVGSIRYVTAKIPTADVPTLQKLADTVVDKLQSGVIVLAGVADSKILFISKVTPDLISKGFHAGNIVREVAKIAGGGGGGRPEFAQAGGKDLSKVDEALNKAIEIIKAQA